MEGILNAVVDQAETAIDDAAVLSLESVTASDSAVWWMG
jgi:hypothetical protein